MRDGIPFDTMFRVRPLCPLRRIIKQGVFFGKIQRLAPVDDFAIGIVSVFSTKWGPTDETFIHNGTHGPPIASERVTLTAEDFRRDIIWRTHGGVS